MSLTYAQLRDKIAAWTENDASEFSDQIDTIIDLAENRIYRECDLNTFRAEDNTLVTVSGTRTVTYTSISPRPFVARWVAIRPTAGTEYTVLDQKDDSYIQELWGFTGTNGVPKYYAMREDGTLLFGPTPNGVYNIRMAYTFKPTSIVSSSTSWLGSYAPDALLFACLAEAYDFMKGEDQARTRWEQKYQNAAASLKLEEEVRVRRTEARTGEQGAMAN